MAKRKKTHTKEYSVRDFASWNFIIFLTLAFILLVVVLNAMNKVSYDLRSRAGLVCQVPALPRAEDCPGGEWKFKRGGDGCETFTCDPSSSGTVPSPIKKPR
ncbi:MAG: hypothetical protein Q7S76_00600 [bacterium]|nr:hypothetical protein [bacterium]